MSDRDILRDHIERQIIIDNATLGTDYSMVEREHSISVVGGPKYQFTENGEIKSIIRGGKSFGPEEVKFLRNAGSAS